MLPDLPWEALADGAASGRVRRAWTAFAATGDPGWPAFAPPERLTWVIDAEPAVQPYPEEASRHLWATRTVDLAPTDAD